MGRTKDIIVLPNGLNVYPEDIENALRTAGIRDSVVLETQPGRIEAIVLAPGRSCRRRAPRARRADVADPGAPRRINAAVKAANATLGDEPAGRRLAAVAGRRLPADAHPQGEARPDPGLGRRRRSRCRSTGAGGTRPRASPAPGPA